jgi:ABC-type multidrug transport system ATPase subunit
MNVEIVGVTRRFGRNLAVAGVDLETGPGVFGLLGPNGAGKTTLLRMLATVVGPSAGTLRLLGRDPASYGPRREIRRRLGYLPQSLGYYPGFTVAEFVEYFALLKEMPPAGFPRPWRRRWNGSTSAGRRGRSCARCPAGCCAGSGSRRPS